jgi:hypothetical protein
VKAIAAGIGSLLLLPIIALGGLGDAAAIDDSVQGALLDSSYVELSEAVLGHPRITLSSGSRADVEAGRVDPRVLGLLVLLAETHDLTWVGPIKTGHSYYVRGTRRVSWHSHGRAVDIMAIDGAPVTRWNDGAYQVTLRMLSLQGPLRPDQVGAPWLIPTKGVVVFDKDHHDHLHAGFREVDG